MLCVLFLLMAQTAMATYCREHTENFENIISSDGVTSLSFNVSNSSYIISKNYRYYIEVNNTYGNLFFLFNVDGVIKQCFNSCVAAIDSNIYSNEKFEITIFSGNISSILYNITATYYICEGPVLLPYMTTLLIIALGGSGVIVLIVVLFKLCKRATV
jgi:hypothetical protein